MNQGSFEDAAKYMASMSASYPEMDAEWLLLFDRGLSLARDRDPYVIECVNWSGYKADSFDDAACIIQELADHYAAAVQRTAN
ncbi:hypothetical protein [Caulobacter sp. 17J80-11]|uniref:hypothetical protein n=1 Tax=Caulobacter sp. 17J80-11 TaxID=2763502 RepID=UPI00165368B6|nr:hypothetical protein [Caulobacter sp. 17J80-11]MBC6983572.1 hypothetical protein [Caulobacter sp. 17J80-11]